MDEKKAKIKELLSEYGDLVVQLDALLVSSGVKALAQRVEDAKAQVVELTKEIRATVSGDGYQAVYTSRKGYGSWDDDKVLSFAAGITDDGLRVRLLELRESKTRAASVSIRAKK